MIKWLLASIFAFTISTSLGAFMLTVWFFALPISLAHSVMDKTQS